MLGLIATLLFCVAVCSSFSLILAKWTRGLDPAEQIGFAGLVGLGIVGTLTVIVGLAPNGLTFAVPAIACFVVALGVAAVFRKAVRFNRPSLPSGPDALKLLGLAVAAIFPLVGALSPSTTLDWDSLAYHLAVPKIWLQAGQVVKVETIHHSNFPFSTDALYLYGLTWGGEQGAKAFSFAIFLLGTVALFGHARRRFGESAGWWASLAFAASPVVLWESGTAYIDVSHGLYVGLGVLYASELLQKLDTGEDIAEFAVLSGLGFGLGMGTKFTGIQTFLVAGLVFLVFAARGLKVAIKPAATVALVALALAAPWFVKTASFTGNPVFPFLYEKLGGEGWNQWRADVYRNEQQTFGVGRTESGRDPSRLGDAILGLAYQPGRYTNPGQTQGGGFPVGAVGFLAIATLFCVAVSGKATRQDRLVLLWVLVSMLAWFFLTQQSRYLTFLVVPSAVMLAGHMKSGWLGKALAGLVAVQLAYTVWMVSALQGTDQMRALLSGKPESYRDQTTVFSTDAAAINANGSITKVALYDQVFGFLLDKPYVWANPGHSALFDPADVGTPQAFVAKFKQAGVSHIYLSFTAMDAESRDKLIARMGLAASGPPPDKSGDAEALQNPDLKWKILLADAVLAGDLVPEGQMRSGILLRVP